jgi:hypothetical protein
MPQESHLNTYMVFFLWKVWYTPNLLRRSYSLMVLSVSMNILVFNKYVYQIMAKLNIDTGVLGNPATGDTLRTAMTKVNTNFDEVYQLVGDGSTGLITTSVTNGDLKLQPNGAGNIEIDTLQISSSAITSITTNSDITITPNGTGNLVLGALTVQGTTLSSGDSSKITLAENVDITGNLVVGGTFDLSGLAVGTLDVDNLNFNDNTISSDSNADINLSAGGTGNIVAQSPFIAATFTTTQRNSLTAVNGMMIYNSTTNQLEGRENGAWVSLRGDTADSG